MAIQYQKEDRVFTIHTANTTYQMKVDSYGYLLHLYYGSRISGSMEYLLTYADRGFSGNPYEVDEDRTYSLDALPQEYPSQGTGDYRSPAMIVKNTDGSFSDSLHYSSHKITKGKYSLPGLPAIYAGASQAPAKTGDANMEAETLEVTLRDAVSGLEVTLLYGVLPERDIITRAVKVTNGGRGVVELLKVQSACLDFLYGDYDFIQFYGRHAMERSLQRTPVSHGSQVICSRRGASSHQYNPFVILAEHETTEDCGGCYGLSFVYSGSFKAEVERDQYDQIRISMGLQDELFSYRLEPGEVFYAPEVVMSYSADGLARLSHNYHRTYRHNLCRGKYKLAPRPVPINNWEATYFDFTGDQICEIARKAAELGVEMLVLDDGWFGKRDSDFSSLGDWYVNEKKIGGPLSALVERINGLGLKFGIWVEPEMVSEDSDLYRAHPDWAFSIPGRKPVRGRNQLVLDFSRKEVVDCIYGQIGRLLDSANIEYIKWDMNRSITDIYSATAQSADQGAVLYRYVLGLYDFLERLTRHYPDLLIEGCSGGGGRFDAGMLYYTPQIWCSDNTDAIDRIRIQYGTSFGYPISAVGSHVSAVPNHQNGRITAIETRGSVAMAGNFGYELDPNQITDDEAYLVKEQIRNFHQWQHIIHDGDYYRLVSPYAGKDVTAWMFVSEDRGEALMQAVILESHGNPITSYVKLKGLDKEAVYQDQVTGLKYRGEALMKAGVPVPQLGGEYLPWNLYLKKIS